MVAVWLTVLTCAVILLQLHPATYLENNSGARPPVGLVLLIVAEIGFWFYAFKDDEGYEQAALIGLALMGPAIALLLIPEVIGTRLNVPATGYFGYLSISHLMYAFANWRRHSRSIYDDL